MRLLAAAGAIVIVAGGGLELLSHMAGSAESGASGGGASQQSAHANLGTSGRSAPQAAGPALHYKLKGQLTFITPVRTATNYRTGSLGREAASALARPKPGPGPVTGGTMTPDHGPTATNLSTLSGCLSNIAAGHRVLLVDLARFNGAPATLIVTAGPGVAREAWIVGPRCSASARDVLAHQPLPGNG
jgi:hypothetical protein